MAWAMIAIRCDDDVDPLDIAETIKESFQRGFEMESHFQGVDEDVPDVRIGVLED